MQVTMPVPAECAHPLMTVSDTVGVSSTLTLGMVHTHGAS